MNNEREPSSMFHIPMRPFGLIDAINRRAAATGSVGYAIAASNANYNGHHVSVHWNDYRGYWIAEHWWGGRVVHCRGSLADCVRAAIAEYDRGALGASVFVSLRKPEDAAEIPPELLARLTLGKEPEIAPAWYSGMIDYAIRTNTTHALVQADKFDGDKKNEYYRLAFGR